MQPTAAAAANNVASTVCNRNDFVTSSSANIVPPIGALNATARPAPPTAVCIILTSELRQPGPPRRFGSDRGAHVNRRAFATQHEPGPDRQHAADELRRQKWEQRWLGFALVDGLHVLDPTACRQRHPPHDQCGERRAERRCGHGHQPSRSWQPVRPFDEVYAQPVRGLKHQRNAPPMKPIATPATMAVTQISTDPRMCTTGNLLQRSDRIDQKFQSRRFRRPSLARRARSAPHIVMRRTHEVPTRRGIPVLQHQHRAVGSGRGKDQRPNTAGLHP